MQKIYTHIRNEEAARYFLFLICPSSSFLRCRSLKILLRCVNRRWPPNLPPSGNAYTFLFCTRSKGEAFNNATNINNGDGVCGVKVALF